MTAICLRAPATIGAGDNQTKAKETRTATGSMNSITKNGNKHKMIGKSRTKAVRVGRHAATRIVVEEPME